MDNNGYITPYIGLGQGLPPPRRGNNGRGGVYNVQPQTNKIIQQVTSKATSKGIKYGADKLFGGPSLASTAAENVAFNAGATAATNAGLGIGSAGGVAVDAAGIPIAASGAGLSSGALASTAAENAAFNAGALGASEAGATAGTTAATNTPGPSQYLGPVALAAGTYGLINDWGNKDPIGMGMSGAAIGAGAVGTAALMGAQMGSFAGPIGMGIGLIAGAALGFIKTGKGKDQKYRDYTRKALIKNNIAFHGKRPENKAHVYMKVLGKKWNIGKDGSDKFIGKDGNEVHYGFESDWSNPLTGHAAITMAPIGMILSNGDHKGNISAQFMNNAVKRAKTPEEMDAMAKDIYDQLGYTQGDLFREFERFRQEGKYTLEQQKAANDGVNQIFGHVRTAEDSAKERQAGIDGATPIITPQIQLGDYEAQGLAGGG